MKYECDMADSFNEGESCGILKGEANATSRIVKAMYSDGLSAEKISQYASLPIEKVQEILQSKQK